MNLNYLFIINYSFCNKSSINDFKSSLNRNHFTCIREKHSHTKKISLSRKKWTHNILRVLSFRNKTFPSNNNNNNKRGSIDTTASARIGWKQRRVSRRHVADSKKSAAHPLCNEFSEFPAHNQSTSARPPFPPTFRLIYRRRHHRLHHHRRRHHHHHHHLLRYIADVVRQASARIASCSPREFKSGQCAVNAASLTTVGLIRRTPRVLDSTRVVVQVLFKWEHRLVSIVYKMEEEEEEEEEEGTSIIRGYQHPTDEYPFDRSRRMISFVAW